MKARVGARLGVVVGMRVGDGEALADAEAHGAQDVGGRGPRGATGRLYTVNTDLYRLVVPQALRDTRPIENDDSPSAPPQDSQPAHPPT